MHTRLIGFLFFLVVAPTGVYHKVTKEYIHVPEMVPEFVVPDLTGFEVLFYFTIQKTM